MGNSAPEEKEEKRGTQTIFEEIITEEKHQETEERHQIKRLFEPQTEFKEEKPSHKANSQTRWLSDKINSIIFSDNPGPKILAINNGCIFPHVSQSREELFL